MTDTETGSTFGRTMGILGGYLHPLCCTTPVPARTLPTSLEDASGSSLALRRGCSIGDAQGKCPAFLA